MKKAIAVISAAVVCAFFYACRSARTESSETNTVSTTIKEVETTAATTAETVKETTDTTTTVETAMSDENKIDIVIIGGEENEYFEKIVLGKETEFPDERNAYFLPAGTYTITNDGDYMSQIDVCSRELQITDGYEEPVDAYLQMCDSGASVTMELKDGYYFEIEDGEKLHFVSHKNS